MQINRKGTTRIVFIFDKYVIKIPNIFNYVNGVTGLLANIREVQGYRWNSGKYYHPRSRLICPILWASWGSWIVVMAKARVLTTEEYYKSDISLHKKHFPGDEKPGNYGYLDGRIVKIDYGS